MDRESGSGGGRRRQGLAWWGVLGLAALGLPRAVAHDLDLVGPGVNTALVFAPVVVWIAVAVLGRLPRPAFALLAVGAVYGLLLGVAHQVLWDQGFAGAQPELGGNLAGVLSPAVESAAVRTAAFVSSVAAGVLVGAVSGAAAWLLVRLMPGRSRT
ncbi:hypothetical protein [Streptomonospora wellingtoniae]|uniref:Uncharacterized protein n=1 Tax=Streptomonospora wellingtoniae TaxID=3075544 RepID=A0ABU2KVJ0_9ACTN|nr:hypothetical protein [Streptomonospora sp. DSM 45055]MDT0303068.1 hypothetical protein [Streptomonospora sp. DSM 45055]